MNYYGTSFWSPTDLAHYGVFGMRWGVRRYQNKDGSLTPAGRKRINSGKQIKGFDKVAYANHASKEYLINAWDNREKDPSNWKIIKRYIQNSVDEDSELKSIMNEAISSELALRVASEKWANNQKLVRKTADEYIKARGKEEYADYYRKVGGIDAAANLWSYYVEKTPELKAKSEAIWKLAPCFEKASEEYFKRYLGDADKRLVGSFRDRISGVLAVQAREDFFDMYMDRADQIVESVDDLSPYLKK